MLRALAKHVKGADTKASTCPHLWFEGRCALEVADLCVLEHCSDCLAARSSRPFQRRFHYFGGRSNVFDAAAGLRYKMS